MHVDSLGRPEHKYVTGSAVELPMTNGGVLVLVTAIFAGVVVPPCDTDRVVPAALEVREKLSVVAVTVRVTVVVLETAPLVPFTVTEIFVAAAMFAVV